jgi:hypothetical protein
MKAKFATFLFSMFLLTSLHSSAQNFELYIANDTYVNQTTFEFDIMIKSKSDLTWALRTVQMSLLVNPKWLPEGSDPSITYITNSTTLSNFTPGLIRMNASPNSLSAIQIAVNLAGECSASSRFTSNGEVKKVGRYRIISNNGPINCEPSNLSFIRPQDTPPAGNVNVRVAVTKWSDLSCVAKTQTTISNQGSFTSVANHTLTGEYKNMAPCALNINNLEENSKISIFPNPSHGKFSITYDSDIKSDRIEIVNSLSQIVYNADVKSVKGSTREMDLKLAEGIYYVRFYSADQYTQKKLVIQ